MADLKTGRAGDTIEAMLETSSSANASSVRRGPSMFTRIAPKDMVSFRSKGARDVSWSSRYTAMANPESFNESVTSHYSQRAVLGLSHDVVQYIRTSSREIDMELWCNYHAFMVRSPDISEHFALERLIDHRNFFESLMVPAGPRLAPPLVTVEWPNAKLHFKGVVTDLTINYTRFAYNGAPIEFTLDLSLLESARGLMTSEGVRRTGFGRGFETLTGY